MDIFSIMSYLDAAFRENFVIFTSEHGSISCAECLQYNGKIFDIEDPALPQLPIHPNCRCKYVSLSNPCQDASKDVEKYRISRTLKTTHKISDEDAQSLAEQVIKARNENSKLREQKLFLLFNGRHLMSSDGTLLSDAVSGQPVSREQKPIAANTAGFVEFAEKRQFDYSYERQAIVNEGGLPQGLYSIACKESGSLLNGNVKKHGRDWIAWGYYHWRLIPDKETDMRNRQADSFTIHGGLTPGSGGCIEFDFK